MKPTTKGDDDEEPLTLASETAKNDDGYYYCKQGKRIQSNYTH